MTYGIEITDVRKAFESKGKPALVALQNISLKVAEGEFLALLGPSGSGKSTLLQIAAGLMPADAGTVTFDGRPVTAPPAHLVYLFQQYTKSLLPWRTVESNVALPLEDRPGLSKRDLQERCRHFLHRVGLDNVGHLHPWQLSGGMQQRVAIARALAAEPRALLLDEPFSAVDALTRLELQTLVLDLWKQQKLTIIMVTHDVDEAVFMADRIAVLSRRPSVVELLLDTELGWPRDAITTREQPRFLAHRHRLLDRLLHGHAQPHAQ